ncbi:NAD(P)H-binding protein [Vitiosangium sp. GDMCC 1.1324]|uniref:NAD(P)H-binding protein n=1 Tax=Vitiosangium sp. (strain GDMCC 1.1324) TaxID=2138576 RepID=UPI000D3882D7|nr:NAD(P)H-binding protein [Vitiosangium sp. GDMCC 1.1324]PTL84055.1 oxidoreductase [Vitiosangium sp. GDMCC 1.1324]
MSTSRRDSARVLVTGATGNTGRRVASRLAELGFPVRTAARGDRSPDSTAEHVRFDWADTSNHEDALRGVDRMYLVAPSFVDDPSVLMLPFIERAVERGVRRVVLLSSSAVPEGAPGLGTVHRALRERVPEWAVLQPSWFMQNFVDERHHHGASLKRDGLLVTATGEGRVGFVDARDIAEVAVRALADEQSHDTAHVITGPQALRYDDVAAVLSQAAGRPMRHVHASFDEAQRHMMDAGIPERYARLLSQLDESIRQGAESQVTQTVLRVTGQEPRSFEAFARAHSAFWTQAGARVG